MCDDVYRSQAQSLPSCVRFAKLVVIIEVVNALEVQWSSVEIEKSSET